MIYFNLINQLKWLNLKDKNKLNKEKDLLNSINQQRLCLWKYYSWTWAENKSNLKIEKEIHLKFKRLNIKQKNSKKTYNKLRKSSLNVKILKISLEFKFKVYKENFKSLRQKENNLKINFNKLQLKIKNNRESWLPIPHK